MSSSLFRFLVVLLTLGTSLSASASNTPAADAFETYLNPPAPAADSFEPLPAPSRATPGNEVRALAHGRVETVDAKGGSLTLEHFYYENHELLRLRTQYTGLEAVTLPTGALVTRGHPLGRVAAKSQLSVTLHTTKALSAAEARAFLQSRARLPLPAKEPVLLLVSHTNYAMRLYERGREVTRVEVGFGQAEGRKQVRGDNRTPMGMYHVVQKHRGSFTGAYAEYYGGHWIRLNYPNPWDADRGLTQGLITREVRDRIARAWAERKATEASTRLGSGIGFHGWVGPWTLEETGGRLSWGCVVMHTPDITALYEKIPEGAMVVLF
ncbi:L,D-transpeptidase [Hyalangium rubrum]|uniref:L,D-transpeptidase n=1 Tax=Hyalangium rubrum TaxID=3103134 RepID=A0ABU5HF35_9BACT|nr:L,D-transpeptidase [Hyalangium sp. s54d21]MDY7231418.1 L,D-transpeptidase [Hyalangium sp. s54d21]